ncbi:MAG: HAD family hydrolase [Bdellovibrionales bacterium]|nr:HAD family hydrolase [Bdellovibrionales bacterium]
MAYTDVIFDLDDTLINTTDQLIPIAMEILKDVMLSYEISITTDELLQLRKEFYNRNPRDSFNTHLVNTFFNLDEKSEVLKKLHEAFYNIPLPEPLMLTPNAEDVLKNLQQDLHLVTSGSYVTQEKKIKLSKLDRYFLSWQCASDEKSLSKSDIFKNIIQNKDPKSFLVIGNRIDNEIKAANQLKIDSCWYMFGEYKNLSPLNELENPKYQIESLKQVLSICQQ